MDYLQTVLQTAVRPMGRAPMMGGYFLFGLIGAVSVLLITVGVFYVLWKLGGLLDAMKEKTDAGTVKK